jgi:hypothetical protein
MPDPTPSERSDATGSGEPRHNHEFEVLEADEDVPPRPEEAAADLTEGKTTPPTKGG